jgi:hypothetical protein
VRLEGKISPMTTHRIQELESLGFEFQQLSTSKTSSNASGQQWRAAAWEDRLSELAEYRKIHGNCNVPHEYSANAKLGHWVSSERQQYKLYLEGKISSMITHRIQELKSLGFEWVHKKLAKSGKKRHLPTLFLACGNRVG